MKLYKHWIRPASKTLSITVRTQSLKKENTRDKNWDATAMKAAGSGDAHWSGQRNTSAYAKCEMGYELEGTGSATTAL